MKKIIIALLISAALASPLAAAFIPTYDPVGNGIYSSPALLSITEEKTTFGVETEMGSDIDGLRFLANPAGTLEAPAKYLAEYLAGKDYSFWQESSELRNMLEGLDANFPDFDRLEPEVFEIDVKSYFLEDFMSSEYGDARRAYAVANALSLVDAYPFEPEDILAGGTYLGLKMYGGSISDNFGWQWNVNMRFDGASSLLDSLGSVLSVDARANIGYAFDITDKFALGFTAQPMLRMETSIPNANYLTARLTDQASSLFTEDFKFGTGLSLTVGTMYRMNDELKMLLDFRNIPSFRSFYDIALTDLASFNLDFKEDRNIYFIPPDIALTALWDRGPYHLNVEISDIVNQIVWNNLVPERSFNFYAVPKVRFTYDIAPLLSITAKLEYESLAFAVDYDGLYAELSMKMDNFGLGLVFGYSF